ncbi:S41 family peptidase [Pontibacter akesuensis]|uniref:Peptidase family S41 n=1 Tax=Pontibacter akesuensis TaxID=388950 RepID=A0A1I7KH19_9BACT|nr:S41 family peptidase [Pontibacter akesuensis]GHA79100.1 peptidase S41 [Pontibacter akesuensis]SFU96733.1 Peptidase family S41 [Pontibacter akesuensis]
MKKSFLLLLTFFSTAFYQLYAQSDSLTAYVTEALAIMKANSVNKKTVDWESVYAGALEKTASARTIRDTYPIISAALAQLKDRHSGFYPPEDIEAYKQGYRAMGMEFPSPQFRMIDNKYAYLQIPAFAAINLEEQREYAASIQAAIKHLDKQKPEGWIIDLRQNDGGMSSPMTAGIGPFVEKDKSVGWLDADGKSTYWIYKKGKVFEDDKLVFDMKAKPYKVKSRRKPVAVLIGKNTSSSGEVVTTSFVGRPNTKLIGTNTQGLTSANNEHELSDGAYLVVTEGNYIDRNNKEYAKIGEGIAPDIRLENLTKDAAENERLYLEAAKEFISKGTK